MKTLVNQDFLACYFSKSIYTIQVQRIAAYLLCIQHWPFTTVCHSKLKFTKCLFSTVLQWVDMHLCSVELRQWYIVCDYSWMKEGVYNSFIWARRPAYTHAHCSTLIHSRADFIKPSLLSSLEGSGSKTTAPHADAWALQRHNKYTVLQLSTYESTSYPVCVGMRLNFHDFVPSPFSCFIFHFLISHFLISHSYVLNNLLPQQKSWVLINKSKLMKSSIHKNMVAFSVLHQLL